ncbi:MAG: magnesium-translocating P-type ATPase [Muribaculaceae bacterium]|nr:magnesium-translocating P-type ATPase [Muribaculaceae bacterium]
MKWQNKSRLKSSNGFKSSVALLREASSAAQINLFRLLSTSLHGIDDEQAEERIKEFGRNEVRHEKEDSWFKQLVNAFVNPFIGILIFIAIVSAIIDVWIPKVDDRDYSTVIVVVVMVTVSVVLKFVQEYRSSNAARRLKEMVETTASVMRNGARSEIDIHDIVPGDIIYLSAGDMIPADCRIIQAKDLFVVQSALTGESLPVEKTQDAVDKDAIGKRQVIELQNICFMGTNVVSGTAIAVAVTTGERTYFGSLSKTISGKRAETSFDKGLKKVSYLLITFMIVMVPVVFLINGFIKGNWLDALLFAVAIAVGLTPEMLPMIVTANLAKGAVSMSKHKVIFKRLNAIQNIGAMDTLCTDKTGTLTIDKVVLERHLNILGESDEEVLKWTYLNSYHQTGLKSLLDLAILEHVELHDSLNADEAYKKIDEIPFDFQRRRMSIVLQRTNGSHLLICKGAVEEMLHVCSRAYDPGDDRQLQIDTDQVVPMDDNIRERILNMSRELNKEGLRVLIVAVKMLDNHNLAYSCDDEQDMIMAGFVGFLDPAKPSANTAIESLQQLGVNVKVLTGDNDIVTKKICRDVGIPFDKILLGNEIEEMSDAELANKVDDIAIFAKLSPMQKSRIVTVLQSKGRTVGFMGDGINDAAALKAADVGISVDTAVDIAKESADIILLEKDLNILRTGVEYGRMTFGNIIKYIKMTTSSNFGNMLSMLGASIFLPFLPMLPIQILSQNMLYDISQTAIPWDRMDEEFIRKPKVWKVSGISRFMLFMGPVSSIFDYATFALMYFVFAAKVPALQSLFQTGWFVEGLLSQTLIVHFIRTRKIPFLQSCATKPVIAMTSLIMLVGLAIPFTPLGAALKMTPLPMSYFPFLAVILICYCLLSQVVKRLFIKKYNDW